MSSTTNQMNTSAHVAPSKFYPFDAVNPHDYGIQKNKKQPSTGGGRAWSEDEEVYLLQTRLQKMPYKHIANHLKKTELACRLHYHQLSHGSNRRKRTNSVTSSGTGDTAQSPIIPAMPSPTHETANIQSVLPKPSPPRRALSDSAANPPFRLDCDIVTNPINTANINKDRLLQIYEAHRGSFWGVIAAEYGSGASPLVLEEAWKRSITANGPPTPCISPDMRTINPYVAYNSQPAQQPLTPVQESKSNATSISALLGIDASPRSPKERELIKRMEESRDMVIA